MIFRGANDLTAKIRLNTERSLASRFGSRPKQIVEDRMMIGQIEPRNGYIRVNAGLELLDSSAVASFDDPTSGYLDLLTADGRLRLAISHRAAEDLIIDLQQFLKSKPFA